MAVDVMIDNGKVVRGSPLFRLRAELNNSPDAEFFKLYAGEVRDVAKACDPKGKAAADLLKATDGKDFGEVLRVRADDLRALVELATGGKSAGVQA